MAMFDNPFILEPYRSKELFCDREAETQSIIQYLTNGRNITLISPRRLGKTGLILRIFDEIKSKGLPFETVYADISDTNSLTEFITVLSNAIVCKLGKKSKIKSFFKFLQSVRPLLGFDPLSGSPQVSIAFASESQKQNTLAELLNYLENYPSRVVVAIDEFQQIREYEGVNMEALLRKHIQHLHNVRFIYCGSKKHTMTDMFTNSKKPFYESTTFSFLSKLPVPVYSEFIKKLFLSGGKIIGDELVNFIIEWTRDHTYYTQRLCNEVFSKSGKNIKKEDVLNAISTILEQEKERFQEIRRLLTTSQWKMLKAIATEGSISQITSSEFLKKYDITSGATALRNINALLDKELVLAETTETATSYSVYNVFLSRYLEGL
ncbi:MAG: ATP-binding protein [Bacteroidales bacterium]|nr:ATP-binding protein [Bacteroidales bacterium]